MRHPGVMRLNKWRCMCIATALLVMMSAQPTAHAQLVIPREIPGTTPQTEQHRPVDAPKPHTMDDANDSSVQKLGIVTANLLNLRSTPALTGNVMDTLLEGMRVNVLSARDEWLLVRAGNGQQGWVHGDYILTGDECAYAVRMMEERPGNLQGTWLGRWEKRKNEKEDAVQHIIQVDEKNIAAAGTVKGWTCWQLFTGHIEGDAVLLKGVGVAKNQRPPAHYVLDVLRLHRSTAGLRLEGSWSDVEGSTGEVEYRFYSRENTKDPEIREAMQQLVK